MVPYVPYLIAVICDANSPLVLINQSRGTSLYGVADAAGHYVFDLANLDSGYSNADSILVKQGYMYAIQDGEILQSLECYYGSDTITKSKIVLYGEFTHAVIEVTADGGSNWESATNNSEHTFTNTGSDLRYRITAAGGDVALYEIRYSYS